MRRGRPGFSAATALEPAWRLVAIRLRCCARNACPDAVDWMHERTVLHCAQRTDGAILGVFFPQGHGNDPVALDKLLQNLGLAGG